MGSMGKRGPDKLYEARLHLVVPLTLKARLRKAAKAKGQTISQWLRELVEQALDKPK